MKRQNLKPDIVLKNYWSDNGQFADLFNAVLFDGEELINPEELEDVDTEESTVLEHREYSESIKASRDNIKIQKISTAYDVQFVLLGMESQEHIHYAMPMRVMGYDYASYKKQYDSNAGKYKTAKGLTEDEYLSRMKRTDKSVIMTVAGATNMKLDYNVLGEGDGNMCTLFEEIAAEGRAEGEARGEVKGGAKQIIEMGNEFGLSESDILERLQNKLKISLQKAQEYFVMFGKQTV